MRLALALVGGVLATLSLLVAGYPEPIARWYYAEFERSVALAERAVSRSSEIEEAARAAWVTARIKAKMVLDDVVRAGTIDVDTTATTVTLTGIVTSDAEHDRAVALARETAGVTEVVDQLSVVPDGAGPPGT